MNNIAAFSVLSSKNGEPLMSYFNGLVDEAMESKASDIYFNCDLKEASVELRKHGSLYSHSTLEPKFAADLCRFIWNILIEEKDIVFDENKLQQGSTTISTNAGCEIKLRYMFQPKPKPFGGFEAVIRLLPQ